MKQNEMKHSYVTELQKKVKIKKLCKTKDIVHNLYISVNKKIVI